MKKKILALTLAAFTFGFVAANAQSTNNATCDKAQTECCKKEAKEGKRADRSKYDPFAGIELTQEQKERRVEHVTYDSQEVKPGTLFICKGAHFKAEYLADAIEAFYGEGCLSF